MAVTKLKKVAQTRNLGNRNLRQGAVYQGEGALSSTDPIVTNVEQFPILTTYVDLTAQTVSMRLAGAGVTGDWISLAGSGGGGGLTPNLPIVATDGSGNATDGSANVRSLVLTGLAAGSNTAITAANTLLVALANLQAQVTARVDLTTAQTLTNKTLTAPKINLGSDAPGDMYYRNGSGVLVRIPAGTEGQTLKMIGGVPTWQT